MTLTNLYYACFNMDAYNKFVICDKATDNCINEYDNWYSIPANAKLKEVLTFSFANGVWYINLVTA